MFLKPLVSSLYFYMTNYWRAAHAGAASIDMGFMLHEGFVPLNSCPYVSVPLAVNK
jgi:hypothetical protein